MDDNGIYIEPDGANGFTIHPKNKSENFLEYFLAIILLLIIVSCAINYEPKQPLFKTDNVEIIEKHSCRHTQTDIGGIYDSEGNHYRDYWAFDPFSENNPANHSNLQIAIGENINVFEATIFAYWNSNSKIKVCFEIEADGKSIYKSNYFSIDEKPQKIQLNVKNVDNLVLHAYKEKGSGSGYLMMTNAIFK